MFQGTFLVDNYKEALDTLEDDQKALMTAMRDLNISDTSVFEEWLCEEKVYLSRLKREPQEETLQMEYWQALVNLSTTKYIF